MKRASTVEIDGLAFQHVPSDIREALSAAADSILTNWESPFPGPNWAALEAVRMELERHPWPALVEQG